MDHSTLADSIINMMLMHQKPSIMWVNDILTFRELETSKTMIQRNNQTIFEHTMTVLDSLRLKNNITLWAALFHDLGKSQCRFINEDKTISFPHHDLISSDIAENMLSRWHENVFIIDRVIRIIKTHMLDLSHITKKAVRDFVGNVGKDNIDNWFTVREADASAYPNEIHTIISANNYINKYVDPFRKRVEAYRSTLIGNDTFNIPVSSDVIQIIGKK